MKYRLLRKMIVAGLAGVLALSALHTPIQSRAADQSLIGQETGVSNGASMDYTVPYTGVYSIFIRGGIGGCDGSFPMYSYDSSNDNLQIGLGGKGAGMAFRLHLTKGTVVHLVSGERGQWSCEVSDDTATRGGSGIANGGNGHWSGGGGGASGISINGQIIAIAAGGGGANWVYGDGGRVSNASTNYDYSSSTGENGVRWGYKMDTGGGGGGWVGGKTGEPEGTGTGAPGAYGGRSGYDWSRLPSNAYYVEGSKEEVGGDRGAHITYRQFYLTYGALYPPENGYQPTDRSFAYGTDGGGWAGITPVSFDPENATIRVIAGTGISEVWFTDNSARGTDISQSYPIGSQPGLDGNTKTGYHFVNWTKSGSAVSTTWPYYITVPEGGGTWTANGAPNTYTVKYNGNGNTGGS